MRHVNLTAPALTYEDDDHHPDPDGPRSGVLMWSTVVLTATVYPDSDKIGIYNGGDGSDDLIVERSSGVDYWHGERRA